MIKLAFGAATVIGIVSMTAAVADPSFHGYAPVFRYDDDFDYLRDPAQRTDPLDVIKRLPIGYGVSPYLNIGIDDRERVEDTRKALLGFGYRQAQSYLLHRLLIDTDIHLGDYRAFLQFGDALESGRHPSAIPTDVDRLDLQQGFFDFHHPLSAGQLIVRAGRQEMSYDEGAIIGLRDGPNVRLSFDGVRASFSDGAEAVDVFAVRPVGVSSGVFDDVAAKGQALFGAHSTVSSLGFTGLAVDAFVYGNTMPAVSLYPTTAAERTGTFGARLRFSRGGYDATVGAIGQVGSFGSRGVLAYAAHANVGYTFTDAIMSPGFTIRVDVLSGSNDPGHGQVHTFNALYPNVAYSTEATIEAPANLIEPALVACINPLPGVRLQYLVESLFRYSTSDAFYVAPLTPLIPGTKSKSRFSGIEQQLSGSWRISDHVTLAAAFVHFGAGAFILQGGGHDEDFGMTEISFRF